MKKFNVPVSLFYAWNLNFSWFLENIWDIVSQFLLDV